MMHAKIPIPKGKRHFMFMLVIPYFYDFTTQHSPTGQLLNLCSVALGDVI
jgi:hypothetical protein